MLLFLMLASSIMSRGLLYKTIFWLQVAFYALALIGELAPSTKKFRLVAIANTFVMLNAAAAVAFYNFVAGRKQVWV